MNNRSAFDTPTLPEKKRKRKPPVELAGKIKERGDVMNSVPLSDWGMEESAKLDAVIRENLEVLGYGE